MPSTNKCEYCGSTITSNDQKCPNCGASNPLYVVDTPRVILTPHTIAELQEYCAERNMPLLRMRFFIGENYTEPKAFGVYYDEASGDYITYKNKADGTRAVRYRGPDEQKAVSELYLKLLDECHNRGIYPDTPDGQPPKSTSGSKSSSTAGSGKAGAAGAFAIIACIFGGTVAANVLLSDRMAATLSAFFIVLIIGFIAALVAAALIFGKKNENGMKQLSGRAALVALCIALIAAIVAGSYRYKHPSGYFYYNDSYYYSLGGDYYTFDDYSNSWTSSDYIPDGDYYIGDSYSDDWDIDYSDRFEGTQTYSDHLESSSSDSDYSSWDSGSTDWGSDW